MTALLRVAWSSSRPTPPHGRCGGCLLSENRAHSAHAHRPLIEGRRKVRTVRPCRARRRHPPARIVAGDHVPRRFSSGQRQVRLGVPAQAAVRERVRRVQGALEKWHLQLERPSPHDELSSRTPSPRRECSLVIAADHAALRHRTEPRGDRSIRRSLSQYASSAHQPSEEQHDRDDQ
jgi:hypothetical protein